jgi:GNAT superfamily N-acetyltransferase
VRFEPFDSAAATALLAELDTDLDARYGGGEGVHAQPLEFVPPAGGFAVLYLAGEPMACGGVRRIDDTTAELKRMYVRPAGRRRGLGRRLLRALEEKAAGAGYTDLWLETGIPQPEAISLYETAGYTRVSAFGQFAGEPQQRCYGKTLA